MDLDKIRASKTALENGASVALQKLINDFEKETSVEVTRIIVEGLNYHPTSNLQKSREKISVKVELEPL